MCRYFVLPSRHVVVGADEPSAEFFHVPVSEWLVFMAVCSQDTPLAVIHLRVAEALEVPVSFVGLWCDSTKRVLSDRDSLGVGLTCMKVQWAQTNYVASCEPAPKK